MIYYQEQNVDLQFFSWGDVQFFFLSTETPALPAVGIWLMMPDTEQVVFWQDYADVQDTGAVRPMWVVSSAAPAVAAIILQRGVERFVFGGMFRRVN